MNKSSGEIRENLNFNYDNWYNEPFFLFCGLQLWSKVPPILLIDRKNTDFRYILRNIHSLILLIASMYRLLVVDRLETEKIGFTINQSQNIFFFIEKRKTEILLLSLSTIENFFCIIVYTQHIYVYSFFWYCDKRIFSLFLCLKET